MPPEASQKLLERRYHGDPAKKDLHESNAAYLASCRVSALFAARSLGWRVIPCADAAHEPLPVEEIAGAVLEAALDIIATH